MAVDRGWVEFGVPHPPTENKTGAKVTYHDGVRRKRRGGRAVVLGSGDDGVREKLRRIGPSGTIREWAHKTDG